MKSFALEPMLSASDRFHFFGLIQSKKTFEKYPNRADRVRTPQSHRRCGGRWSRRLRRNRPCRRLDTKPIARGGDEIERADETQTVHSSPGAIACALDEDGPLGGPLRSMRGPGHSRDTIEFLDDQQIDSTACSPDARAQLKPLSGIAGPVPLANARCILAEFL
jgi:hypothetical protein